MEYYCVKKFSAPSAEISVPASKSILNRALLLAAFTSGTTHLVCGDYGNDTRDLISCLADLDIKIEPKRDGLTIHGTCKVNHDLVVLNVGSAGTVARFLTTILAFRGGNYEIHSSKQMQRRPMEILRVLETIGVRFEYLEEKEHLPFRMFSNGITTDRVGIDTDVSTQYASGIMLAAAVTGKPFTIRLKGSRTNGSYLNMTLRMIQSFGVTFTRRGNNVFIASDRTKPQIYTVEPDISAACYFFALALLTRSKITVRGIHSDSIQGDMKFIELLEHAGVRFTYTERGLRADGSEISEFSGFRVNMQDFSDQVLTVAAIAPFATCETEISGIAHIRVQECDRIAAIAENLATIGVPCSVDEQTLRIFPALVRGGIIKTYNDHRVAMAFTLIGLKCGNVTIEDPMCCKKTFDNYFEIIDRITQ